MSDDEKRSKLERQLEELLRAMDEEGVAGGTIAGGGVTKGAPNWEDRTRHQRFAQKVRTHGYPPGLAKSTRAKRDRLLGELQERLRRTSPAERSIHHAVHEALAWALDAERFLGSFNRSGQSGFRPEHVDEVADHLLVWLAERGCTIVRDTPTPATPDRTPMADLVLALDAASGMLLDGRTARFYEVLDAEGGEFEEPCPDDDEEEQIELNTLAATWCQGLQLSEGSGFPPSGQVGQYGQYGCVLLETAASPTHIVHDVCLFPYDDAELDDFVEELADAAYVEVVASPLNVREVAERINGLHPLSRYAHRSVLDRDLSQITRRTDIEEALAWGREHAERIA